MVLFEPDILKIIIHFRKQNKTTYILFGIFYKTLLPDQGVADLLDLNGQYRSVLTNKNMVQPNTKYYQISKNGKAKCSKYRA